MSALLEVKALQAGYGRVPVLHGVDFEVEEGEIVGVLGHNGMGKSTLLKTIMGIVPATGGAVDYAGSEISRETTSERARRGIGYVPQGRGIFANLTVRDNIRMGLAAHPYEESEAIGRVLAEFPLLEPLLDRDGGALSGGQQQLLAIARCLVSEPELILLDEPTEGIQPSIIDRIIELLQDLNHRRGVTVVMVEQNLDFITELSHRVLLLQKGVISGEVKGSDAANPALIEEFTGFGNGSEAAAGGPHAAIRSVTTDSAAASVAARAAPSPIGASVPVPVSTTAQAAVGQRRPAPVLSERISYMTAQRPTHSQLKEIVAEFGMHMSDAKVGEFLEVMQGTLEAYDVVDGMPDYLRRCYIRALPGTAPRPKTTPSTPGM